MIQRGLYLFGEGYDMARSLAVRAARVPITKSVRQMQKVDRERYVILFAYDRSPRPDIKALLDRFADHGCGAVIVTSNGAADQYADQADLIVRITRNSRDFTGYQQGFMALEALPRSVAMSSLTFCNDSVWYFRRYQSDIVSALIRYNQDGLMASGTAVFDELPHVSGWLFSLPITEDTRAELHRLFARHFVRRSRQFHIRNGEHQILPKIGSVVGFASLDQQNSVGAFPHCYQAVTDGGTCFYLKADATLRTNASKAQLARFLTVNSEQDEAMHALRWISQSADRLLRSPTRLRDMSEYRRRHFG